MTRLLGLKSRVEMSVCEAAFPGDGGSADASGCRARYNMQAAAISNCERRTGVRCQVWPASLLPPAQKEPT
jgi:hypothetical protein